jgi:endonuclease/exonuclease/phosphatase family metal-dependent hydrolase
MRDNVAALRRVVSAMRTDVLCVQEAPRFVRWRSRRKALAEAAGLRVATPGRAGGVAVLAGPRARVLHGRLHRLKAFAGLERRVLAVAVVEVEDVRLAVGSLHLDLHGPARVRHAAEAMTVLDHTATGYGAAIVLGGDINEGPDLPAWRYLAARLTDCYAAAPEGDGLTFTAGRPAERIDAVFAARGARVVSCGGVRAANADLAGASDHLPVLAELHVGL